MSPPQKAAHHGLAAITEGRGREVWAGTPQTHIATHDLTRALARSLALSLAHPPTPSLAHSNPADSCLTVTFTDTYGDGWEGVIFWLVGDNGATFSGTLDGDTDTHTLCDLGTTCFDAYMTGSASYPTEIGWSVVDSTGDVDVDGSFDDKESSESHTHTHTHTLSMRCFPACLRLRQPLVATPPPGHRHSAAYSSPLALQPSTAVGPAQFCVDGATKGPSSEPTSMSPTLSAVPTITRPTYTAGTYSEFMTAKVRLKHAPRMRSRMRTHTQTRTCVVPLTHTHVLVTQTQTQSQNKGDDIIIDLTGPITLSAPLAFNGQTVGPNIQKTEKKNEPRESPSCARTRVAPPVWYHSSQLFTSYIGSAH